MKNLKPQQKKDLVRFVIGGLAALLISKSEKFVNKKADDYFGPDEPKKKKKKD
jgi:hypothetical protein